MSSKFGVATKTSDIVEVLQSKIMSLQNIINKTTPLIFLLDSTTIYEFDTDLTLDFPVYNLYTDISINANNRISFQSYQYEAKIKITIRLMYNWAHSDFAPRFKFNLIVNCVIIISDSSDVNDSSDSSVKNISNIVFIHHFLKNDVVEITLSKSSGDDSLILFKNSIFEFNYV